MKKILTFTALGALMLSAWAGSANAGAGDSPTLKRIQERGVVSIGHRETSIPFSYLSTTFITGTKIASKKGSGITEIEDLDGKIIGLSSGTTNERAIKAIIAAKKLNVKVVPVKDHSQGWLALDTDRIDAYGSDDVLLYGLISKSKDPSKYQVTGRYPA